jgi:NitT/TauT family transport system ATP-binding protein
MYLIAENVEKVYRARKGKEADRTVLRGINVSVDRQECLTMIGPSGCGKSTLLRCMAGLIPVSSGKISVGGEVVSGPSLESAMVFQNAALLPWRTVEGNVRYGLELRRDLDRSVRKERVQYALEAVGLQNRGSSYPHEISGGMQQRVNLARALASMPSLLLMDEPFGALDSLTKESLHDELQRLVAEISATVIFVTHDIEEAVLLGDRVMVMSPDGEIVTLRSIDLPHPRRRDDLKSPEFRSVIEEMHTYLRGATDQLKQQEAGAL